MNETSTKKGRPMPQFSVMLENRAGSLSALVELLNHSHIEVLGMSLADSVDVTVARLVVSAPEAVEPLFVEKGIPYVCSDLVLVELDGASSLNRLLKVLLKAETSIQVSYALMNLPHGKPVLAMNVEDADFAISVLNQNGFKTLYQDDIVR